MMSVPLVLSGLLPRVFAVVPSVGGSALMAVTFLGIVTFAGFVTFVGFVAFTKMPIFMY